MGCLLLRAALIKMRGSRFSCPSLLQVSALGQVYRLDLSHTGVRDVSALGRVHDLDLSYTNVDDVSALQAVRRLNLAHCRKVTDVRMLAQVGELDVTFCISLRHPLPLSDARCQLLRW